MGPQDWSDSVKKDVSNWMSYLSDDLSVTQITMPGSHDSHCTYENAKSFVEAVSAGHMVTQYEIIKRQLEIGVRYLDLRCGHPQFQMCHDNYNLSGHLGEVLQVIKEFLDEHCREVVLVSIKWDNHSEEPKDLEDYIGDFWTKYGWFAGDDWPKIHDVRKKAVLLHRFNLHKRTSFGVDFRAIYGEEHHTASNGSFSQPDNGTSNVDPEERWRRVKEHLKWTATQDFGDKKVHFNGGAGNGFWTGTPEEFARRVNPCIMRHLGDRTYDIDPKRQRYGVIVMDYIVTKNCLKIICKNWQQAVWQPGGLNEVDSDDAFQKFDNGVFFSFQKDRNFVAYGGPGKAKWSSETWKNSGGNLKLQFQGDNNLCIYDNQQCVWDTKTDKGNHGTGDVHLRLMGGPPYIMIEEQDRDGNVLWCPVEQNMLDLNRGW